MKKLIVVMAAMFLGNFAIPRTANAILTSGSTGYAGIGGFSADVDWEVYAPGDPDSALDPSTFYDYFYVITNTSTPSLANEIWSFSIGNPTSAPITSAGYLETGGVDPSFFFIDPAGTSFLFIPFFGGSIAPGSSSDTLFLTSPYPPALVPGGLLALGGASDTEGLPGPLIPEPATMALLGSGLLGFAGLRRKRS